MKKILIADDETHLVMIVQNRLEANNYEVITAFDGEEALAKAKEKPDLILLDIMMPKMDGFEVARRLKADPLTQAIPIFMFTSQSHTDATQKAIDAGASDYIVKPFNPKVLLEKINKVLGT